MFMSKNNSIDVLLNTYKTNLSGKSATALYKLDNNKTTSRSEEFKDLLSSKAISKEQDTKEIDYVNKNNTTTESNNDDKVDELKEKLEELEEESKSASKDEVNDILTELLNLLAKFDIKEDLTSKAEINENASSSNSLNSILEKILRNLSDDLVDNNAQNTKNIKNLMTEISNIIDNNKSQTEKVSILEDMLNKNYSQDNKESSTKNEGSNFTGSKSSKEDKFLNSLIGDKDSSFDKINLYASRTATMQNQGADTVRGLTINKATFANDLVKDIKFMSNNALKELIVKVNPGNLGEMTIKLVQEDGIMKANLKVNSKETVALISQNLTDIKKQLAEQNIKIADVSVELYQGDTTFFRGQGFGRQLSDDQERSSKGSSGNTINDTIITEEELVDNIAYTDNNLELYA